MNNNIYLNFIYEAASKNYLKERVRIGKFLKDKKVAEKNIVKKRINVNFFICEIELEDKRILLLEDIPVNFLLGYTITIGDKAKLLEFSYKDKKYICDKNLFDDIKEQYDILPDSLKNIRPRELYDKEYYLHFTQPTIVSHLKEYVSSIKRLSFNKIHIIKGDKVENFVPTIKKNHLTIAEEMNIPLVNLLENNFIKESTINIYDDTRIQDIIKPVFSSSKKILWDVHRKNNLRLYKDVSREYVIEFDKQKVIDELFSAHIVNFEKDSIARRIKNTKCIVLSSNHGKYALPVWKSSNEQRFILIEDVEAFKSMAGVNFKLDTEFFEDIYLQTLSGEQAIYKPRYLSEDLNRTFESLKKSQKINFSTIKELIIKIIYNLEMGVMEVTIKEDISEEKINHLNSEISRLLARIIRTSIDFNRKPTYKRATEIFEEYYFSIANSIMKILDKYKEYPSRKELLNSCLKISERVNASFKIHELSSQELYFVCLIIINLLEVQKVFDKKKAEALKKHFYEYFKDFKPQSKYSGTNPEIENLVDDIFLTNKVSSKRKAFVLLKKDIGLKVFSENVEILNENPRHFPVVKPNVKKLMDVFKYSYQDAISQISALNINDTKRAHLSVRGKEAELKDDYYSIFDVYSDYNVILDNDFFRTLIHK